MQNSSLKKRLDKCTLSLSTPKTMVVKSRQFYYHSTTIDGTDLPGFTVFLHFMIKSLRKCMR